ncbi:c-type cytochrome [Helicobacter sp. MIT 14-3879]|uniref:c-type cytochrome n=1 Tax=Helicobacter sp. MIT 14-3879 TaxID=2040649 RepID=UPI000E1F1B10|nr:c-type cytochrome [Helicobacter sp. MIT 14-3879]RDU65622.1 cytochrome C oxidase Cbb3 [Helicobacter sp. MIT 14-3879]
MQSLLNDNMVLLTLFGAFAILVLTAFVVSTYFNKIKHSKADGVLTDDSWDGIKEFKNDLPIGWAASFLCVIIWGLWYIFVGYPLNAYSQIGEYNREVDNHNNQFQSKWASLSQSELTTMGDNIFQVQCSQCHGFDKTGINGKAADLSVWGRVDHIVKVILEGSEGMNYTGVSMIPIEMSKDNARDVANFVMNSLSEAKIPASADSIARGKELYLNNCVACHGEDGKGLMPGFAPDLTTYGTHKFLQEVLKRGKNGHIGKMPSFEYAKFSEFQEKALNDFILSDN